MNIRAEIARCAAGNRTGPPPHLGRRYDAARFLPEAGNTVICHLDTADPAHRAVLAARARMQALPEAGKFLYTPVDSLHMTVFEGVIETRRTADAWPADIGRNAPVDEVTERLVSRLAGYAPPSGFAVRAAGLRPAGLLLEGATAADGANMRAWRDALTGPFGYRQRAHDTYRFHMTFAYPVDWISDALLPMWEAEFRSILADLRQAAPVIPLRPAAFCRFGDMTRFEEILVLGR